MRRTDVMDSRELRALERVDAALGSLARRRVLTVADAVQTLVGVRESIDIPTVVSAVQSIVDDAVVSFWGTSMVDRGRVMDPLLDIRIVLALGGEPAR